MRIGRTMRAKMKEIKKIKGTMDILPEQTRLWRYIESVIRQKALLFGFEEIRFPTFEATELFCRGVGGTTDIVQKEMYTFNDKDGSSISLRPEGTACVVRSLVENGLYARAMPQKLYYLTNFFRHEKPQAGRSREFFQFGTEIFGSDSPGADVTVISTAASVFEALNISGVVLKINSIGCPECRGGFQTALKEYFAAHTDKLCPTCLERLKTNPLRILDCKSPICASLRADAPKTIDYLCESCADHNQAVQDLLDGVGIKYEIDPFIVRGLDYYTKTVFEFVAEGIGSQSTVCGGGRYDGLVEELGGPAMSGVGFGMGITRLINTMEMLGVTPETEAAPAVYFASLGSEAQKVCFALAHKLRLNDVFAESDICARSLKAQMKYADKIGAKYTVVIGDSEIEKNECSLRNMKTGESVAVPVNAEAIKEAMRCK